MKSDKYDDRLFDGDEFTGTYVVYGATPNSTTCFVCDVDIHSLCDTDVRDTRAYRESNNESEQRPLGDNKLNEELAVVIGPGLSTSDAIAALHRVIENLETQGMLAGQAKRDGAFLVEMSDGGSV